jgi:flagellar hook assembly protein FlgD
MIDYLVASETVDSIPLHRKKQKKGYVDMKNNGRNANSQEMQTHKYPRKMYYICCA